MEHDTETTQDPPGPEHWRERRAAALAGHQGDEALARRLLSHPVGPVRATALGALARMGRATAGEVSNALADADPSMRRRACEVAVGLPRVDLVQWLADADSSVAEAAAWACGERAGDADHSEVHGDPSVAGVAGDAASGRVVEALSAMARGHEDPLCREAAVAALGALGDPRGLSAVLAATTDRPAVRRRAVIALAPFDCDNNEVHAALERARTDRDWQVRQAAEDLLAADDGSP